MVLKNQWLPVCLVSDLSKQPKRFILLDIPLVIFRLNGQAVVLEDRCPHRGAPLSAGKLIGDTLQCAYHGWRFNTLGACVAIPGLTETTSCDDKRVPAYDIQLYAGLVFVCLDRNMNTQPLCQLPLLDSTHYSSHLMQIKDDNFSGSALNIIENVLDATHTHFVHSGLIRRDSKRQMITATLSVNEYSAEVRYDNEQTQSGLISSLFENSRNYSLGRFRYPLIAELEYYGSKHATAGFTFFISPITSTNEHRIFLVFTYRKNWLTGWLKKQLMLPFIKMALRQDKKILMKQAMNLTHFPDIPFKSTELDLLRSHIERIINGKSVPFQKNITLNV